MRNCVGLLALFAVAHATWRVDDTTQHVIRFKSAAHEFEADKNLLAAGFEKESITLKTLSEEKYVCYLPKTQPKNATDRTAAYTGPTASKLVERLYDGKTCSQRVETYWAYELCHGRFVTQFHDDVIGQHARRTEYYLGNFNRDYADLDVSRQKSKDLRPPKRRIDEMELAYHTVVYRHGTVCDITGKPRLTHVHYLCIEDAHAPTIYSIQEIASCEYELLVLTNVLCEHPSYRSWIEPEHDVLCYLEQPVRSKDNAQPEQYAHHEHTFNDQFKQEYRVRNPEPQAQQIPAPLPADSQDVRIRNPAYADSVMTPPPLPSSPKTEKTASVLTARDKSKLPTLDEVALLFLEGRECVVADQTDHLTIEFCHGIKVSTYKKDAQDTQHESVLGVYNVEEHRKWVDGAKEVRGPDIVDGAVREVWQMYTGGDVCPGTEELGRVLVRLVCKPERDSSGGKRAPSDEDEDEEDDTLVTLQRTQGSPCEWTLLILSRGLCPILQYADEYGLIQYEEAADHESVL